MSEEPNSIDAATDLLRSQTWTAPPQVSRLRTDVRSGENFLISTAGTLPPLFIGAVIVEWGFEVPRADSDAFHDWLKSNEANLASDCPAGVQYRGTYAVFAQSSPLGSYRTIWAFDSLAAMEALSTEVTSSPSFGDRLKKLIEFRDESIGASRSQQIYHPAATATRT